MVLCHSCNKPLQLKNDVLHCGDKNIKMYVNATKRNSEIVMSMPFCFCMLVCFTFCLTVLFFLLVNAELKLRRHYLNYKGTSFNYSCSTQTMITRETKELQFYRLRMEQIHGTRSKR